MARRKAKADLGVQVAVTVTVNGEKKTMDLRNCELTIACGQREVDSVKGFRAYEATDDITIKITGKRS
jgi:hypothetical protein